MTRLEQLAALATRVDPVRASAVGAGDHSPGPGEVAYVVTDQDGADLAAAYNALPALMAVVTVANRVHARALAKNYYLTAADRKALAAAFERLKG